MKPLNLFYLPSCAFSAGTLSFLMLRGADFHVVNLDEHPDERRRLEEKLGGKKLETPTLEIEGKLHVAPSLSELKELLEQWGLPEEAAPHKELKKLRS